jgi:hypothetical protein
MAGGVSSVSALVIDPSDSSTLYSVAHGTVVKSTDGAQSWSSTGFPLASVSALAIDPQNTFTVYAARSRGADCLVLVRGNVSGHAHSVSKQLSRTRPSTHPAFPHSGDS